MAHYGTLEDALSYHADRGNVSWSASGVTDEQRTSALLRASEAIDGIYGKRFSGRKASRSQERAWPRVDAVDHCADEPIDIVEIPFEVEAATYALALVELSTPGATTPVVTPGKTVKRQKVGPMEREFFGPDGGVTIIESLRPVLTVVEDALRCLLHEEQKVSGTVFLGRV